MSTIRIRPRIIGEVLAGPRFSFRCLLMGHSWVYLSRQVRMDEAPHFTNEYLCALYTEHVCARCGALLNVYSE